MTYARSLWNQVALRAASIGEWFGMLAFQKEPLERSLFVCLFVCLFVSPILDMEQLIHQMMCWANVTELELNSCREIETDFREVLS